MYNGWTKSNLNIKSVEFPFTIFGYGRIENWSAWCVFLTWFEQEMDAHKRTLDALAQATMLDDVDDSYDVRLQEFAVRCLP
jgi:hypothetical protein